MNLKIESEKHLRLVAETKAQEIETWKNQLVDDGTRYGSAMYLKRFGSADMNTRGKFRNNSLRLTVISKRICIESGIAVKTLDTNDGISYCVFPKPVLDEAYRQLVEQLK